MTRVTTPPVALIAFNRPALTRRTLAAVRLAKPQQLFVILDGPRTDRVGEADACAAVRREFEAVDWLCEVRVRASPFNLGCEGNVETGLDWVFSQVSEAVVLEDDCVPDPSFFRFADELLERYRDDDRVWHIAGNSHSVPRALFGDHSYAFASWASVWGWATWADRWQAHRELFPRDHVRAEWDAGDKPVRSRPVSLQAAALVTPGGRRHFAEAAESLDVVTHGWDKHWWLSIMSEGGVCVTPAVNVVENVGFGPDATHTAAAARRDEPRVAMRFPLRHPHDVRVDVEVERELELVLGRVGGRGARLGRRLIRSPRLRRMLRELAHSPAAVRASRRLSKLASGVEAFVRSDDHPTAPSKRR